MRIQAQYPAQTRDQKKKDVLLRRVLSFLAAVMICLPCCVGWAEGTGDPAGNEDPFAASPGSSMQDEDASSGSSAFVTLTDETFSVDDLPEGILEASDQPGRVEKVHYITSDETGEVKSAMVYLPRDYDTSDVCYNVLYLLHGSSSSPKNYLDPKRVPDFQCLLDHLIEEGRLQPLIVVAPTYYPSEGFTQFLPLAMQVEVTSSFPRELVEDVIPAVEEKYRTYAASVDPEGIRASRDHRAVAGFSLGGTAAWYVFLQQMQAFRWFLPISEASWDDGEGGTSGIWDSDVSAQVLYDAVVRQGFQKDDFRLYVATGTEDEAFEVSTNQMISLLEYADLFKPGDNTSCSMMIGGTHTITAVYTPICTISCRTS